MAVAVTVVPMMNRMEDRQVCVYEITADSGIKWQSSTATVAEMIWNLQTRHLLIHYGQEIT
jgi:hypothetical protein